MGLLEYASSDLREKAQIHQALKATASKIRGQRHEVAGEGRDTFRGARRLIEGAYEESAAVVVGLNVPPLYPLPGFQEQCLDVAGRRRLCGSVSSDLICAIVSPSEFVLPFDSRPIANHRSA